MEQTPGKSKADPTIPGSKKMRARYARERREADARRRAAEEAREDAALRAKYAHLPPLEPMTLGSLGKAARGA